MEKIIKEFAKINYNKMEEMLLNKYNTKLNVWSFYSRLDELMLFLARLKLITVCESYKFCEINYERVQEMLNLVGDKIEPKKEVRR